MNIQEIISWLDNKIIYNTAYHNHKESMAWVATTLYLTGSITGGLTLGSSSNICEKILTMLLFLLLSICATIFIHWQFSRRWIVAGRMEGLIRAGAELLNKSKTIELDWEIDEEWLLPKFITKHIPPKRRFDESRYQTEFISYAVIVIGAFIFLILIFR